MSKDNLKGRLEELFSAKSETPEELAPARAAPPAAEREYELRFKALFDLTPLGMALVSSDGLFLQVNPAWCAITGYPEAELLARRFRDITHPEDVDSNLIALRQMLAGEIDKFHAEKRYLHKTGRVVWVQLFTVIVRDEQGHPLYFISQLEDITARKRAEEALRESQARLAEAMRIAHIGNWEYDVLNDTFTFNDQFYALLRTTAEREGGYTMRSARYAERFVHPDDAPVVGVEIQKAIETTEPHFSRQLEHRIIYADGETGYISVQFRVEKDAQGRTVKTYGANQDITEREQLLADQQQRALQLLTAAEVSRAASSILSLDELLPQTVELIRHRFNLYYVGIFLVDDARRAALLRAGTGPAGQSMIERSYQLEIGDSSMIGWSIAHHKARIALDTGQDAVRFENPLLPDTRSELALPLISRGRALGAMSVQSAQPAAFGEQDITVLQTMADQVANAIANARLFEETQAAIANLSTINEINQTLSLQLELRSLLALLVNKICAVLGVPGAYIALYDRETDLIHVPYMAEAGQYVSVEPFPLGEGRTSVIIRERRPLLIDRARASGVAEHGAKDVQVSGQSYLGMPIIVADEVIGVLAIQGEGLFGEAEERLLSTLTPGVGIAIQNARLYEQTQAALAEARTLYEVSARVNAATTPEEILQAAIGPGIVAGASGAGLWRIETDVAGQPEGLDFAATWMREGPPLMALGTRLKWIDFPLTKLWVNEPGRPLFIDDIAHDQRLDEVARRAFQRVPVRSVALVPVMLGGRWLGLGLIVWSAPHTFTAQEQRLYQSLASQVAVALDNQRLLEQAQGALAETHRRAQREQLVNQITSRMRAAVSVDEVLRVAVEELRQATHATHAAARLGGSSRANGDGHATP
ncbi:MAG TPA: GAF domain-containing protein [Anaerolineae bacterium]|nr:GAF domain-containing protein [Anaerolineae bacterium]